MPRTTRAHRCGDSALCPRTQIAWILGIHAGGGPKTHLAIEARGLAAGWVLPHKPHAPADQQVQALRRVILPAGLPSTAWWPVCHHGRMLGRAGHPKNGAVMTHKDTNDDY